MRSCVVSSRDDESSSETSDPPPLSYPPPLLYPIIWLFLSPFPSSSHFSNNFRLFPSSYFSFVLFTECIGFDTHKQRKKVLSPPSSIYLFPSIFFGPIVIVLIGYSPPISVRSIFYFYTYENLQEPLLAITIVLCCFLIGFVPIKISTHTHTRNEGETNVFVSVFGEGWALAIYCIAVFVSWAKQSGTSFNLFGAVIQLDLVESFLGFRFSQFHFIFCFVQLFAVVQWLKLPYWHNVYHTHVMIVETSVYHFLNNWFWVYLYIFGFFRYWDPSKTIFTVCVCVFLNLWYCRKLYLMYGGKKEQKTGKES